MLTTFDPRYETLLIILFVLISEKSIFILLSVVRKDLFQ